MTYDTIHGVSLDRIALISDVHGNLTALDAVLADIGARGIEQIINLGDYVGKGPRGADVVDRCRERCEVNIRGNWDDFLPDIGEEDSPEMRWWRDEVRTDQLEWLRGLRLAYDLVVSGRQVRLFHASARSPHHRVREDHTREEFAQMFANTPMTGTKAVPSVVGYGDIHSTYVRTLPGRMLFNVGSVGNPLDEPVPSYVILEGEKGNPDPAPFGLQFVRVPYDVEAEIAAATDLGMPALQPYAKELRTAVYRGLH